MSDLLPIVAGCKALVLGVDDITNWKHLIGSEVNVIRLLNDWEVDTPRNGIFWKVDVDPIDDFYTGMAIDEHRLMRTDGHKEDEKDQQEELIDG